MMTNLNLIFSMSISFLIFLVFGVISSSSSSLLKTSDGSSSSSSNALPTLYEYYLGKDTKPKSGLVADSDQFYLNGKQFVIYSGSLHYFRIVPEYWKETLKKFKAAGLNTVQFYLPWNLHQPKSNDSSFDFESYGLNLKLFLEEIHNADLFAIVRPGPYICAEWEWGGLPSWLLKDPNMKIRTNYAGFIEPVKKYFRKVFEILNQFQFSKNGGPIIALQLENEYYGAFINHSVDYIENLYKIVHDDNQFQELLFTSDPAGAAIKIPLKTLNNLILETANLNSMSKEYLIQLKKNQPNRPGYISEFWPGWFDSWGDNQNHHRYAPLLFEQQISDILFTCNSSVNFYMFIGGTNFAFLNGARVTTSYDYDAPLSESGNYTEKYWLTRKLYDKLVDSGRHPNILVPDQPPKISPAKIYVDNKLPIKDYLSFNMILNSLKSTKMDHPISMEYLDDSSGFGFILYRIKTTGSNLNLLNITGPIKDRMVVILNDDKIVGRIDDGADSAVIHLNNSILSSSSSSNQIDILVENLGRSNYGGDEMNQERKGINSPIYLDNQKCNEFEIFTFDFDQDFMYHLQNINGWMKFNDTEKYDGPRLYRTSFMIEQPKQQFDDFDDEYQTPQDTFILLPEWTFGNIFINNFNLGRYDYRGPQKTLYIPGPLLKYGENILNIFELGKNGNDVKFIDHPILG